MSNKGHKDQESSKHDNTEKNQHHHYNTGKKNDSHHNYNDKKKGAAAGNYDTGEKMLNIDKYVNHDPGKKNENQYGTGKYDDKKDNHKYNDPLDDKNY